jgi:hypothetical protein
MADRKGRFALGGVALFFLLIAMLGAARAATITVNTLGDPGVSGTCDLRDAIINANGKDQSGSTNCTGGTGTDTIVFSISGTITLGSMLPAIANTSPDSLTIDGSGHAITVDGASTFRIFNVNFSATLNLQNLTLAHGSATGTSGGTFGGSVTGGAIDAFGSLTIANCTFSDNQATGGAGSMFGGFAQGGAIWGGFPLTVTDSTFSGNQANGGAGPDGGGSGQGGAIYDGFPQTITNSTFSDNQATGGGTDGVGRGGAVYEYDDSVIVVSSTFSGNHAAPGVGSSGGAIYVEGGPGPNSLKSTILAGSTGGNCAGASGTVITDGGYNISDDNSCGFTMAPSGTSINNSTTLRLDPAGLQENGGPTKTIALEPDSEAVDFIPIASCTDESSPTPQPLTTDQRGFPRPDPGNLNFCDAGSFELQPTMPFAIAPNSERLQIARSTSPNSDQINTAFTFTENGFPSCDAGDDAFNGVNVDLLAGSCETHDHTGLFLSLDSWVVHMVNKERYGTLFQSLSPGTVSARMVQLPTPASPACGEWTVNIEVAGIDSSNLGNGPFSLVLSNPDGDQGCFDITNAVVGNQIPTPGHGVRRGVRR